MWVLLLRHKVVHIYVYIKYDYKHIICNIFDFS